jgi:hypothetical protein
MIWLQIKGISMTLRTWLQAKDITQSSKDLIPN